MILGQFSNGTWQSPTSKETERKGRMDKLQRDFVPLLWKCRTKFANLKEKTQTTIFQGRILLLISAVTVALVSSFIAVKAAAFNTTYFVCLRFNQMSFTPSI